jgi:acyl-CoA dehydrogenase
MSTVQSLPPFPRDTLFTSRSGLPHWLKTFLPSEAHAWLLPRITALGENAARLGIALGDQADREGPQHIPFDALGNRVDQIRYHPAYRELERLSYGAGLVGLKYDPKVHQQFPATQHQMGFTMTLVFAGAESGMLCPLCMTDGVARVLKAHAPPDLQARAIPRLAATDMSQLWRGAMFLTEKQGGSDVKDGNSWKLYGDKWFCSNVDAQVALVLARTDDAPAGTHGLGLYYLETNVADGSKNGLIIHRIKDKLGTRSMPTGEVTFTGATATLLGGPGAGFKMMLDMVNLSRLYNATVAVGVLNRALEEVTYFAQRRTAFGKPLTGHRMHMETLADQWAIYLGNLALVMACAQSLDAYDSHGDKEALGRVRLLTPLAKRHTGRTVVDGVSMCLELMGGQAYIEDTGMPRLLRDAQVLPIWEGTSHMQMWDVQRAALKDKALEPAVAWLCKDMGDAAVRVALEDAARALGQHPDVESFGAAGRHVVDALTVAVNRALLVKWGQPRALLAARRLGEVRHPDAARLARAWSAGDLATLCGVD